MKLFGVYGQHFAPSEPHHWLIGWGWVTYGDECGFFTFYRFEVWIASTHHRDILLWRGRRRRQVEVARLVELLPSEFSITRGGIRWPVEESDQPRG